MKTGFVIEVLCQVHIHWRLVNRAWQLVTRYYSSPGRTERWSGLEIVDGRTSVTGIGVAIINGRRQTAAAFTISHTLTAVEY